LTDGGVITVEIESTTRMGWNYQLRGANVKAMVDSTWKVKCFFETQVRTFFTGRLSRQQLAGGSFRSCPLKRLAASEAVSDL